MGDEQNGFAFCPEGAHDVHQLVNFLGCQHGGGLVEDQNIVIPVEHLEDLHPLLHTHGDVLHPGIRVNLQAVALRQLQHPLAGIGPVDHQAFSRFRTQDDIVQHREALHQLKVLVHHANVQGRGIVGVLNLHHLAILLDDTLLGLVQAEQYAHQRGLASAVFPQQGMNLPPPELKRYIVIGLDAREFLGDIQHFNYVIHHAVPLQSDLCILLYRKKQKNASTNQPFYRYSPWRMGMENRAPRNAEPGEVSEKDISRSR